MKKVKLGDIATVITKGATPTTIGFNFVESGINFVKIESITENGQFLQDKFAFIDEHCNKKMQRSQLQENDILFSIAGAIGRTAIVTKNILPANTNQALAIIRIPDGKIFYPYLLYVLQSPVIFKQFEKKKQGVAQLNLSLKDVSEFEIPLPSLEEQKAIAGKLDKVSGLIEKRKTQLEKLDLFIKSRFIEMFGDPVINSQGWETAPLSRLIIAANNGLARRGKDEDGSIVLRLVELQNGFIDYSAPNRIKLTEAEQKRYKLIDNDFLFARVNGNPDYVGRCAVFNEIEEPVYHNDHIIRVHFDENKINGCFTSVLLNSDYGKRQLKEQIKTSAGQYTISQDGIGAIITIIPPLQFQRQFAVFVEQIDKSKFEIQKSLEKLEILKKSLMQQYFG